MYSILIVDDEPLTREYMKINIPSIHDCWTVSGEAGDGAEALEFLEKHTVNLVITDIKMPVMNGLELCKNISLRYPGQKIIILSGYDEFSYAKEAILYGVNEYLLKPIIKEELRTALDTRMRENTRLTVTAGMGTPINDLLQLSQSYKAADLLIISGLLPGRRYFYSYADGDVHMRLKQTEEVIAAVKLLKSGFMDGNEMNYSLALAKLSDLINCTDVEAVVRCGIYIIKSIVSLKTDCSTEKTESALKLLKSFSEDSGGFLSKGEAVKLFKGIIGLLLGNSTNDETANRKRIFSEEGVIDQAKDYIFTHYSEPVSLALIAENVGVSSGYLSQLFHKTVGESYIQFLTRIRMEQAAKLLCAYPDERISNICEKVGYLGDMHFTYVFKQYFRVTPGEYQNNCKVSH